MFRKLYPDHMVDSVYDIDFDALYNRGMRGVIFDIDNTLTKHGAPPTEKNIEFFARLKSMGMKVLFLSNNKEPRVKMFRDGVDYGEYIFKGGKPGVAGYVRAMEKMGTSLQTTFFVGDQLFTDVWGANKTGIESFLVKPIDKHEEIQIVLKRILEKPILACYKHKCKKENKKKQRKEQSK